MTPAEVHALAVAAGLDSDSAVIATAIAWAESNLNPNTVGDVDLQDDTWGPSVGLWQVRTLRADKGTGRARDADRLLDAPFNAWSMVAISAGGTNWTPWSVFKNGRYLEYLAAVRGAVEGGPVPTPVAIILAATAHLEELGYDVHFEPGWEDRGRPGSFEPQGLVCHHTADRAYGSDYAILSAIRDGIDQGGSWLAGPLAQFGLGRSGTVYVVAAGKANHAGPGGWGLLSGNGTVWGIEAANDGMGEPWPAEQLDAYLALAAALARFTGFGPESVCRHAEWSTAGKIDTATAPLNSGAWIRAQVAERLAEPPDPTPVPKEDDMASPFVLLTYGSGVALWHPSGDVVPLASAKQVTDALTRGDVVMDDLTDEQVERITGAKVALTAGPALAELVRAARGEQEPLSCAGEA